MSSNEDNTTGKTGAPPQKALFDPGWNDPPTLEYSPSSKNTSGHTRLNLNKRVGIPQQTSNYEKKSENSPPEIPAVPHIPPSIPKDIVQSKEVVPSSTSSTTEPENFDKNKVHEFVFNVFRLTAKHLEENRISEILKRIDVIEEMWKDNKFNDVLSKRIYLLAKAMESKSIGEANEIHRSIIIDYGSLSTKWGPALRQIILSIPVEIE